VTGLEVVVALLVGVVVGVLIGSLGAGGSIVTVPALILLLGLTATQATGTSLVVVLLVSAVALAGHLRSRRVDLRGGLLFALVGVPAALAGGRASVLVPDVVLTSLLVVLLLATAVWLARRGAPAVVQERSPWWHIVTAGVGVGGLTGLLGVGGGFVVVPALVGLLGLPMSVAIGTSQVVLVVNAAAGLLGRFGSGTVAVTTGVVFAAGGAVGAVFAERIVRRASPLALSRAFVVLLVVVSLALGVDVVRALV
jgi:uncharacterized membrane protein YfcA